LLRSLRARSAFGSQFGHPGQIVRRTIRTAHGYPQSDASILGIYEMGFKLLRLRKRALFDINQRMSSIDFPTFTLSVASAAMMGLGLAPRPETGKTELDLEMARQNIGLLEMIQEKTKNNLTPDEEKLLERVLFEVRTKFVEVSKKK
jgi:hypothetical protein